MSANLEEALASGPPVVAKRDRGPGGVGMIEWLGVAVLLDVFTRDAYETTATRVMGLLCDAGTL